MDRRIFPLALAIGLAASWAGGSLAATVTVTTSGFAFSPPSVTIQAGDTVSWTTIAAGGHTVTSDRLKSDGTPLFDSTTDFAFTFPDAGTYDYHCRTHVALYGMRGTVDVRPAGSPGTPTTTPRPLPTAVPGQPRRLLPVAPKAAASARAT